MKILQIVELTNGILLSKPKISECEDISISLSKVKRADLFFAHTEEETWEALELGAYAIVCEKHLVMNEALAEIAYIKVEDLQAAKLRVMRFLILKERMRYINMNTEEFAIAKCICVHKQGVYFFASADEFLEICPKGVGQICCLDSELLQKLHLESSPLVAKNLPFVLISRTLFEMRIFHSREEILIRLPYLLLHELSRVVVFFEENKLHFDLARCVNLELFKPYFVDIKNCLCEYGKSERVMIGIKSEEFFARSVDFFQKHANWGVKKYILHKTFEETYKEELEQCKEAYKVYENLDDLCAILERGEKFNFMLVLGLTSMELEKFLISYKQTHMMIEPSLFDWE